MATLSNAIKAFSGAALLASTCLAPTSIALAEPTPATVALTPGQCAPAAQVQAALRAQAQVPIVLGNRVTTRIDRPVNIFTSNGRGEGYWVEGDQPQGTPSTTVCVKAHFQDLHINDINSPTVPSWALMGNDADAANGNCRSTGAGLCTSHDDYVRNATANGQRVMLGARSVFANADGTQRSGRQITMLTQVQTRLADVTATNSIGASETVGGLENVNYTQYASTLLAQNGTGGSTAIALASLGRAPH
jgi:hypothetical protein